MPAVARVVASVDQVGLGPVGLKRGLDAAAETEQRGEPYIKCGPRYVQDAGTGERIEVPLRFRRW